MLIIIPLIGPEWTIQRRVCSCDVSDQRSGYSQLKNSCLIKPSSKCCYFCEHNLSWFPGRVYRKSSSSLTCSEVKAFVLAVNVPRGKENKNKIKISGGFSAPPVLWLFTLVCVCLSKPLNSRSEGMGVVKVPSFCKAYFLLLKLWFSHRILTPVVHF